ncbi:MAG: BREX system P-loop protein BrxC, partial [Acidobacteria bacterium]|nr:BREX system P-loop protein BrxC [Acidobacteriota bacterium]
GPDHRLLFLVDEVGQFIGTDSHLMLNLQTITEELGTICQGRAWVVVTSQEDIDSVLGEMKQSRANDFSKIQGRFRTRLSLSSANVDEVIQSRLLAKHQEVEEELRDIFKTKGDILKNHLTFTQCGMTLKPYKDRDDFVRNYPFAPYQFQLVQKIFEAIRRAGATGLHLSRGERSVLDAFQSAGKQVALNEIGILVPLYRFYPSIESFLDTAVKRTIDQARVNASLEDFDIHLLQVLFLIRYVDEMKGNVDNLVTLCLDQIDADRLALRRKIEASLGRLEKETLISRNGDLYFFLTNEERDIGREIKSVEINSGEEPKLLGELIFTEVLKDQRKYRYPVNKMDFAFNRVCDLYTVGNRSDGALQVSVVTPLNDDYDYYDKGKRILESGAEGGQVLFKLGNDDKLSRELRIYLQTDKYVKHKSDGTQAESTKKILRGIAEDNQERRGRLVTLLDELLASSEAYVASQQLKLKSTGSITSLHESLEYLVRNTFNKMGYLKKIHPDPLPEIQAILRSNDIAQETLDLDMEDGNKQAVDYLRNYVELCSATSKQVVLYDLIDKKFSLRPYGWPENEVLVIVARLLVLGQISLMMDGALIPLDKVYEAITSPAKQRKILLIKRQTSDPAAVQKARSLGKELFHEMGPDGEDPLFTHLQIKLKGWQSSLNTYKPLADTGDYPGKAEIDDGLVLIKKLLSDTSSFKFIERFNTLKDDLLEFAGHFQDLEQFYEHQKPSWEKLRKAHSQFQLNRMELDRDVKAGPPFRRIEQILDAKSPYALIHEGEKLINSVAGVNTALLTERRNQVDERINGYVATLSKDIAAANGDENLRVACLRQLESVRQQIASENSLAHITQAEGEALKEFDLAVARIEVFAKNAAEKETIKDPSKDPHKPTSAIKKQRIVEPAKLVKTIYLETTEDVAGFLDDLRQELETGINNNERIQIR